MSSVGTRWIGLSPYRKSIVELMHLAQTVPLVTAERPMNLDRVVRARNQSAVRPNWSVIFCKAFAMVAVRRPELRRAYMSYPWPHLYEHSGSVASIMVERIVGGEEIPVQFRIRNPESVCLMRLHDMVLRSKSAPMEEFKELRQMRRIGKAPAPIRRLLWRLGYHWSGRKRAHYFGTFALSSPAAAGAGLSTIISPVTCTLHYGMFDEVGRINMRLTFDHRAIDGAPVARALSDLEETLQMEIAQEIEQMGFNQPLKSWEPRTDPSVV